MNTKYIFLFASASTEISKFSLRRKTERKRETLSFHGQTTSGNNEVPKLFNPSRSVDPFLSNFKLKDVFCPPLQLGLCLENLVIYNNYWPYYD